MVDVTRSVRLRCSANSELTAIIPCPEFHSKNPIQQTPSHPTSRSYSLTDSNCDKTAEDPIHVMGNRQHKHAQIPNPKFKGIQAPTNEQHQAHSPTTCTFTSVLSVKASEWLHSYSNPSICAITSARH